MFKELGELVDEVRLTFHAFSGFASDAHRNQIDPAGRAVLEYLSKSLPSTVPAIARSRGVTRQHIQTIVNQLELDGLVEATANPAHKRSSLFALTPEGRTLIDRIVETEHALLEPLLGTLDLDRLTSAAETLSEIRDLLSDVERPA